MRKSQFQKTVAHHEAGHAVVARLLGVEIAQAFGSNGGKQLRTAQGGSPMHGGVTSRSAAHEARGTAGFRAALKIDVKIALAGPAAQRHYRPQSTQWTEATGEWEDDLERAWKLAFRYCLDPGDGSTEWTYTRAPNAPVPPEVEALVNDSLAEVTKMVVDNWSKVERVAALLLKHGDATQVDIDAAMAGTVRQGGAGATIPDVMDPQHQGNEDLK